jgi:hypothetical protein
MSGEIPSIAMQSGQAELALEMGWYGIGCDLTCDVTTGGPVSTNFFSVSHQKKSPPILRSATHTKSNLL